jgi:hypothetical protein
MEISVSKECIAHAKDKMQKAILHLEDELKNFRAGKANPGIFQNVLVDYYGTPTPVPQVASVTTPDAKTILIQPWEKKLIPAIEKAILDSNIGYTPANNGEQIRINVPALTEERRKELVKQIEAIRNTLPYNRFVMTTNMLVPLDDEHFRDNPDIVAFKYGGNISIFGYVTNIIAEEETPVRNNDFAPLYDTVNKIMINMFKGQDRIYVVHPVALFY